MQRYVVILLTIGLTGIAGIANAHTLDSEHSLVETLWHQVMGSHHLPYTLGLLACGVVLFLIGRRSDVP